MAFTHLADAVVGSSLSFVKVFATTTALSAGDAAATTALNAITSIVIPMTAQAFITGAPYAVSTGSAVIFVVPRGPWSASAIQTAVRATGLTGLTAAVVTVTDTLIGA